MNELERLKAMLDERGVEHGTLTLLGYEVPNSITWQGDVYRWMAILDKETELLAVAVYKDCLTAEQTIDVTLGRGECHPVPVYSFDGEATEYYCDSCSECEAEWMDDEPNFCPSCGRRVVEVRE